MFVFVSTEMSLQNRRTDAFLRAFLASAWSGFSNYASKAVVEVSFNSIGGRNSADWLSIEIYVYVTVMIVALVMQVYTEFPLSDQMPVRSL